CRRLALFRLPATPTTEICTLSLHDALPICRPWFPRLVVSSRIGARIRGDAGIDIRSRSDARRTGACRAADPHPPASPPASQDHRSEEHTSELQSRENLVCRLLLEKKKDDEI